MTGWDAITGDEHINSLHCLLIGWPGSFQSQTQDRRAFSVTLPQNHFQLWLYNSALYKTPQPLTWRHKYIQWAVKLACRKGVFSRIWLPCPSKPMCLHSIQLPIGMYSTLSKVVSRCTCFIKLYIGHALLCPSWGLHSNSSRGNLLWCVYRTPLTCSDFNFRWSSFHEICLHLPQPRLDIATMDFRNGRFECTFIKLGYSTHLDAQTEQNNWLPGTRGCILNQDKQPNMGRRL